MCVLTWTSWIFLQRFWCSYFPLLDKNSTALFLKNKPNYTPVGLKGLGMWLVFEYGDKTCRGESFSKSTTILITPSSLESQVKRVPGQPLWSFWSRFRTHRKSSFDTKSHNLGLDYFTMGSCQGLEKTCFCCVFLTSATPIYDSSWFIWNSLPSEKVYQTWPKSVVRAKE